MNAANQLHQCERAKDCPHKGRWCPYRKPHSHSHVTTPVRLHCWHEDGRVLIECKAVDCAMPKGSEAPPP